MKSNFLKKQSTKDVLAIVAVIALYNAYISIAYDTLQYLNIYKVLWAFIGGAFVFVPMYVILWGTLRRLKSNFWFLISSLVVWSGEPVLMSQGHSKTFNAWQGSQQQFENGALTLYGYLHGLQNPFFFLALYATILLIIQMYRTIQNKQGE